MASWPPNSASQAEPSTAPCRRRCSGAVRHQPGAHAERHHAVAAAIYPLLAEMGALSFAPGRLHDAGVDGHRLGAATSRRVLHRFSADAAFLIVGWAARWSVDRLSPLPTPTGCCWQPRHDCVVLDGISSGVVRIARAWHPADGTGLAQSLFQVGGKRRLSGWILVAARCSLRQFGQRALLGRARDIAGIVP